MNLFGIFVIGALLSHGCSKNNNSDDHHVVDQTGKCTDAQEATIIDRTGLDGCHWLLKLSDGSSLEPTNLSDFDIELVDNKLVFVSYTERTDMVSICMVGAIVDITCMEERN